MTPRIAAACLCVVFASGCVSAEHFRAETLLRSDGSVDRAIWQPRDKAQHEHWDEVRSGVRDERLQSELWEVVDNSQPKGPDGKTAKPQDYYTSARGRFASAEKIPEHYRKEAPKGLPASILKRKVERDDFVFVTEHRWEETLTDCVHLDDIPAARRELVDLAVPIIVESLSSELGTDYDVSEVERWLRDEGATWFDELTALFIDLVMRKLWPANPHKEAEQRLIAVNRRHGLENLDRKTVEHFAESKVKRLVKRRDGQMLDEKLVAEIVRWITFQSEELGQPKNRFSQSAERFIKAKYQSDDVFQEQAHSRVARILGLHHPVIFTRQEFDYRLTVPGFVVETTGELTTDNRVRWRFDAGQAFPFGYAMRCRSLQPNEASQRAVFNDVILKSRNDCERLVRLLKAKPEWRETLATCVTEKSRQPLLDLRKKIRNDLKARLQFEDLESLLRLVPQF